MKILSRSTTSRFHHIVRLAACLLAFQTASQMHAQSPYKIDMAVTYNSEYALVANTSQSFWMQGGSIELGTNTWKGLGIAAKVTGAHASAISSGAIPLSIVTAAFGGRYRWHAGHKTSVYVEGLAGEASGFDSLFPSRGGAQTSANGLATQAGGGIDYSLSQRFAIRVLEASWVRTTLPNATISVEDDIRLGAGVVVKFGH